MALNTTVPTIVTEMINGNKKLLDNLDESSTKILNSLVETLNINRNVISKNAMNQNSQNSPDNTKSSYNNMQ